ncbi:MAG: DUF4026 domain-containing protein [Clostridia bacterium]|jgi:uncharacterized protein YegJ (DUF2314 family)|nr:DUF4026 domain-containing protein [Clostridia bacterium]
MFFNKNKGEELKEEPLGYWEKESYMLIVPEEFTKELLESVPERVAGIEGVKIVQKCNYTEKEPEKIILNYEDEEYEVGYYPSKFTVPEMYINQNYHFTEEEIEKLKNSQMALTIYMKFNKNAYKSYHLQLKLALAMVPDLIGVMDESAEKMLPTSWVKMTANSKVLPRATDLFIVQAVSDDKGEVWLHTHGLCRCGITELEILQSDKENYNNHYNLITTFASYLIDKKEEYKDSAYIGFLSNKQPIVVTYVPWTKGLNEYKKLNLGGVKDRESGHNSKTGIVFLYKSEEDEKEKKFTKVSEFDKLWGDNPVFFISDEETKRMKDFAMEKFDLVREEAKNKENKIIIKIGLPVDDDDNFEHIWFELMEVEGEKFKAKLLQEPYNVANIHEGDERWFTVKDVTDWIIYTKNFTISPRNSYLLME